MCPHQQLFLTETLKRNTLSKYKENYNFFIYIGANHSFGTNISRTVDWYYTLPFKGSPHNPSNSVMKTDTFISFQCFTLCRTCSCDNISLHISTNSVAEKVLPIMLDELIHVHHLTKFP